MKRNLLKLYVTVVWDKAPCPDGMTMAFLQANWVTVIGDVMTMLSEVFTDGKFVANPDATFNGLIPKKVNAENIRDYRPISLVGCIYKLLSRVLARRLRVVNGDTISENQNIISEHQNAFVGGRQILDVVLIANDLIDSRIKSSTPRVVCKLDIEKAYDHINWHFLIYLMRRMAFGERWVAWIHHYLSSASFAVLVNGSPSQFFSTSRRCSQRDPISPLLFLLVREFSTRMLHSPSTASLISGFSVGQVNATTTNVSHLLFADDTIIFCDNDCDQIVNLHGILIRFEVVSSLRVKLTKSFILPIRQVHNIDLLRGVLDCTTDSFPASNLVTKFKEKSIREPVVERFERRLSKRVFEWKSKYLSKGGGG